MDCDICARCERAERGENRFVVARTTTGYVALADQQYHEGYTIFAAKTCVPELHFLHADERDVFLREMAVVAQCVFETFMPRKLNYELLGNGVPHLHWHLFPRHDDDPHLRGPVWEDPAFLEQIQGGHVASAEVVDPLKARLRTTIERSDLAVERWF
jgi:diadenosine tetraphosphate (Ap4A) HIT family hydrolase